ncbi:hypothetical protein CNMCM8694_002653 [Aspergillus lentulus]|nr:hypothetical protein CNMCM8060_003699 [Aspergillus lentulus]KAF4190938.1 hypothetical protein CNMCM8694_002653 [Aspergillus lentulus]
MSEPKSTVWQTGNVTVQLVVGSDEIVHVVSILPHDTWTAEQDPLSSRQGTVPQFRIRLNGEGNPSQKSSKTLIGSYVSSRLKYQSHHKHSCGQSKTLDVIAYDEVSPISVTARLSVYPGIPVIRSTATICNESQEDIAVDQLSSLIVGALCEKLISFWLDYTLSILTKSWFREAQCRDESLPSVGLDDIGLSELPDHHDVGSWSWELGDFQENIYLALGGPTNKDHGWKHRLPPGQSFTSVPVALCHDLAHPDNAFAALSEYHRRIRKPHKDNEELGLIFNDSMNCLMGDPHRRENDSGWWDDVGVWEPSTKRFPKGLRSLLDRIRSKGSRPDCGSSRRWLVFAVWSRTCCRRTLSSKRMARRIVEKGRYQPHYRHPEVIQRLKKVIDHLVPKYGVGYSKFDYNIEVVQGTDVNAFSPADGRLGHNRAYLEWVGKLYDRFPDLVIESCSSGGQRMDYALLAAVLGTSSVVGPLIGGAFTSNVSWRWCDYISLPIGGDAMPKIAKLNLLGKFFLFSALICLLLALRWGNSSYRWGNWRVILLFILFGICLVTWAVAQALTPKTATIKLRVIKNRSVEAAMWFMFCLLSTTLMLIYYHPVWLQAIKNKSAVESGIDTLPLALP